MNMKYMPSTKCILFVLKSLKSINQTNKQINTTYINNPSKVEGRGHWNQLWKEIKYDFAEIIH